MEGLVGNLQENELGLKNTYRVTESGLLIPHPVYFFSDSCAHAIGNLSATVRTLDQIAELGNPKEYSVDALEKYQMLSEVGNRETYEKEIDDCRYLLDEVLAITSPNDSAGIAKVKYRGKFDDRYIKFFNPQSVKELFNKVSQEHFDFKTNKSTENIVKLTKYWKEMQGHYHREYKNIK